MMRVQRSAVYGLFLGACLALAACSAAGPAVETDQSPPPAATPAGADDLQPTTAPAETPAVEAPTMPAPTAAAPEALPTLEAAPTEASPDTGPPPAGSSYVPIDPAQCDALQTTVQTTLNVADTAISRVDAADFQDYISNTTGQGCQIVVTGTGNDFPHFVEVATGLRNALAAQGWVEDPDYGADGPTGTAFAMRQDDLFSLVSVEWTPSESAECPPDRPIMECVLPPDQMLYTIALNFARLQ